MRALKILIIYIKMENLTLCFKPFQVLQRDENDLRNVLFLSLTSTFSAISWQPLLVLFLQEPELCLTKRSQPLLLVSKFLWLNWILPS